MQRKKKRFDVQVRRETGLNVPCRRNRKGPRSCHEYCKQNVKFAKKTAANANLYAGQRVPSYTFLKLLQIIRQESIAHWGKDIDSNLSKGVRTQNIPYQSPPSPPDPVLVPVAPLLSPAGCPGHVKLVLTGGRAEEGVGVLESLVPTFKTALCDS